MARLALVGHRQLATASWPPPSLTRATLDNARPTPSKLSADKEARAYKPICLDGGGGHQTQRHPTNVNSRQPPAPRVKRQAKFRNRLVCSSSHFRLASFGVESKKGATAVATATATATVRVAISMRDSDTACLSKRDAKGTHTSN